MKVQKAFTLIELLIVVAIIGILAAIAVPNFLNAQTRAKIARVQNDLRSIQNATDMYRLDHGAFPWPKIGGNTIASVNELSTPVAYLSNVNLVDPFNPARMKENFSMNVTSYVWVNYRGRWAKGETGRWGELVEQFPDGYAMNSQGPDHVHSGGSHPALEVYFNRAVSGGNSGSIRPYDKIYNLSNGLYSKGDICRFGGEIAGMFLQ